MFNPPPSHLPYTDKYFIRSRRILEAEGLNPTVTMQVFFRDGPGIVAGVDAVINLIDGVSTLAAHGGKVFALPEGSMFSPLEPVMHIEGPILDFIELETLYVGTLTARTSTANGLPEPDLAAITERAARIREMLPDKNLMYFGARHWHWSLEEAICKAVVGAGFDACATDAGAHAAGKPAGVGTIPHALVLAIASKVGRDQATREAALAFDRHMEPECPRIALVDTFNREIDDSLAVAEALGPRLAGVRLDTAGELIGQGGVPSDGRPYWTGQGVTVTGALAVRRALDAAGYPSVDVVLSSGFGDLDKVAAFAAAERENGPFFTALGIGGLFPAWCATADIVRVNGVDLAKSGRAYRPNPRLVRVL